jgi:hypothetical protein
MSPAHRGDATLQSGICKHPTSASCVRQKEQHRMPVQHASYTQPRPPHAWPASLATPAAKSTYKARVYITTRLPQCTHTLQRTQTNPACAETSQGVVHSLRPAAKHVASDQLARTARNGNTARAYPVDNRSNARSSSSPAAARLLHQTPSCCCSNCRTHPATGQPTSSRPPASCLVGLVALRQGAAVQPTSLKLAASLLQAA